MNYIKASDTLEIKRKSKLQFIEDINSDISETVTQNRSLLDQVEKYRFFWSEVIREAAKK